MTVKERYAGVIAWFQANMPVAESELQYKDPFGLLVAVILSAQCTDRRVNMTTPALLAAYPDAKAMSQASVEEIYSYIKSISYPNNKARHLSGMSKALVERFGGEVPQTTEELMQLPGVGRKTANVIASVAFHQPKMAVDTHVFRVAERIGLTTGSKTPLQTELTLTRHIDRQLIPIAHHWLILHGRYVCLARKPHCSDCGLTPFCRYYNRQQKKGLCG